MHYEEDSGKTGSLSIRINSFPPNHKWEERKEKELSV